MTCEAKKVLTLTKEEREIISEFYDILNNDKNLDSYDTWEIFTAIRDNDNTRANCYDYTIIITD